MLGGVGERFNPPVLKTGAHFVGREFKSRPLRQFFSPDFEVAKSMEYWERKYLRLGFRSI